MRSGQRRRRVWWRDEVLEMKIKIMDLLGLTKTWSFVLSYPVPF